MDSKTIYRKKQLNKCIEIGTNLKNMIDAQSDTQNPLEELEFFSNIKIGMTLLCSEADKYLAITSKQTS